MFNKNSKQRPLLANITSYWQKNHANSADFGHSGVITHTLITEVIPVALIEVRTWNVPASGYVKYLPYLVSCAFIPKKKRYP